jgi:hypothetical protein
MSNGLSNEKLVSKKIKSGIKLQPCVIGFSPESSDHLFL